MYLFQLHFTFWFFFLVPVLQSNKIISEVFPLHCTQSIEELRKDWVQAFFSPQPLGQFPPLYRNAQNKLMELSINHNPYDESVIFSINVHMNVHTKMFFLRHRRSSFLSFIVLLIIMCLYDMY